MVYGCRIKANERYKIYCIGEPLCLHSSGFPPVQLIGDFLKFHWGGIYVCTPCGFPTVQIIGFAALKNQSKGENIETMGEEREREREREIETGAGSAWASAWACGGLFLE